MKKLKSATTEARLILYRRCALIGTVLKYFASSLALWGNSMNETLSFQLKLITPRNIGKSCFHQEYAKVFNVCELT